MYSSHRLLPKQVAHLLSFVSSIISVLVVDAFADRLKITLACPASLGWEREVVQTLLKTAALRACISDEKVLCLWLYLTAACGGCLGF